MKLTIKHARKIQSLVRCGIPSGKGLPEPGKMCIEHIICHVIGKDNSDQPTECVLKSGIEFKIALNDKKWPTPRHRAKGLERIGLAQLGSEELSDEDFRKELQRLSMRIIVPIALRATKLKKMAILLEKEPTIENCLKARDAAYAAYANAAANAAADAHAYAAANAAANAAAANAAAAAAYAANAAYAAAAAAYAAAYAHATRFKILWISAELGVLAFRHIKSPGCKWMDKLSPMTDEFKELVKDNKVLCEELGI